jgi:serine/threonine-protein kinase
MSDPHTPENEIAKLMQQAELYEAQGLLSHALDVYRDILRADPENRDIIDRLRRFGEVKLQEPNPDISASLQVQLYPRLALDLGIAFMGMGLYEEALDELRKGMRSSPRLRTDFIQRILICLIRLKKLDLAESALRELLAAPNLTPTEKGGVIAEAAELLMAEGFVDEAKGILEELSGEYRVFIPDYAGLLARIDAINDDVEVPLDEEEEEEEAVEADDIPPTEPLYPSRARETAGNESSHVGDTEPATTPLSDAEASTAMSGNPAEVKATAATTRLEPLSTQEALEAVGRSAARGVKFACLCGTVHSAPRKMIGEKKRCPNCGRELLIPPVDRRKDRLTEMVLGTVVGGCRILYKLGGGGMGGVYRARHLALDVDVAVKVLHAHLAEGDPIFVKRFLREARAAAKLQHPHIVGVLNVGFENGLHYLIMPYVGGGSAQSLLNRQGTLPVGQALDIGAQIASALEAAAEHDILHRDIKPANILFTEKGEAKLADLGLAKSYSDTAETAITQTGIACGTPLYFSPEQAKGSPVLDVRSDIYSLGITMYHLIEGTPPFTAESAYVIFQKHLTEPLPPFKKASPPVPDVVFQLIKKMTAKKPEDRFSSAHELLEAIEAVREEILSDKPSAPSKKGFLERLGLIRGT